MIKYSYCHLVDFDAPDHEHAYVRVSSAAALAAAVVQYPQTARATLHTLQALYRNKVS